MQPAESRFGPYEVFAPLGAGGMGEVFKARDRRLDRIVALKTSREQFTDRFAREARASAALNHPHIATLYDVGPDYLVMEFVEGETLQGPLPAARAMAYARQILNALDAAHRKGIIHCDLKPANILISKGGVKLLDFGLAQIKQKLKLGEETSTMVLPAAGEIAGTLQYMAPEQLQGKPADARTDIFAFGLLLYEMLTGQQIFQGSDAASVISAVMSAAPRTLPVAQLPVAPGIERIILQCLAKDPDDRWQSAADIERALDLLELSPPAPVPATRPNRWAWRGLAAAFVTGALITIGLLRFMRPAPEPQWTSRPITYSGRAYNPALSPDGKQVAFLWLRDNSENGLYIQLVNGGNPLRLPVDQVRGRPAWSPDSSQIAFVTDSGLNLMAALGGSPRRVAEFPSGATPAYVAWSPSGRYFVVDLGWRLGLSTVSAESAEFKPLTKPTAATDYYPALSPDGRAVAFIRRTSTYNSAIVVLPLTREGAGGGTERTLTAGIWNINSLDWTSNSSAIIFEGSAGGSNASLWRIDSGGGTPLRLNMPSAVSGAPSVARQSDRMVYVNGQYETKVFKIALGSPNASHNAAEPQTLVEGIGDHSDLAVAPDGSRIAFVSNRTGSKEVWTANADGSGQTQITFYNGPAVGSPHWSPDGRQIVFDGYAGGSSDIYLIPAAGGKALRLTTDSGNEVRPTWAHDGQWIYYSWDHPGRPRGIWKIRPSGGEPVQVVPFGNNAHETPDGKWLYVAGPSQLWRIRPDGTEKTDVSSAPGNTNEWNLGARSLFMLDPKTLDLLRMPFSTGVFENAYHFDPASRPSGSGTAIAVPSDESYAIYRKVTRSVNTLTLIEGFR
jgi:eukaryotic-like serine/threonine-protein kinase